MAKEADEAAPEGAQSPEGVFGNLPSSRPGSRSPRRRGAGGDAKAKPKSQSAKASPAAKAKAKAKPKPKPKPRPKPPASKPPQAGRTEPAAPEQPADPLEPTPGIHGVEDLAWAGVAVAAQAATAGVRFASRALETARKSIDRP